MSIEPTLFFPSLATNPQARGHGFYFADNVDAARIEQFVIQARHNELEPIIRLQDVESGATRTFSIVHGQAFELTYEPVSAEEQAEIHEDTKSAIDAGVLTITSWKPSWFVNSAGYAVNSAIWDGSGAIWDDKQ